MSGLQFCDPDWGTSEKAESPELESQEHREHGVRPAILILLHDKLLLNRERFADSYDLRFA